MSPAKFEIGMIVNFSGAGDITVGIITERITMTVLDEPFWAGKEFDIRYIYTVKNINSKHFHIHETDIHSLSDIDAVEFKLKCD